MEALPKHFKLLLQNTIIERLLQPGNCIAEILAMHSWLAKTYGPQFMCWYPLIFIIWVICITQRLVPNHRPCQNQTRVTWVLSVCYLVTSGQVKISTWKNPCGIIIMQYHYDNVIIMNWKTNYTNCTVIKFDMAQCASTWGMCCVEVWDCRMFECFNSSERWVADKIICWP